MLYTGSSGRVAHECIRSAAHDQGHGVTAEDVAKRLADYGFHAPTLSFPVAGTLMVEPTESESLAELDRFCDAMIAIGRGRRVGSGEWPEDDNPLRMAPTRPRRRRRTSGRTPLQETAVFPSSVRMAKYCRRCPGSTAPAVTET